MNYAEDMKIDHNALDVEWLNQPMLMMKYSEAAAKAERAAKLAEERVKTIRSELILKANAEGEAVLGAGVKAKDATVEAYYRTHPDYLQAVTDSIEATHDHEVIRGAIFAFHHRRDALENLVKLVLAQYFASPTEPRDLNREFLAGAREAKTAQTQASILGKLNERPRRRVSQED